MSQLDSLDHSSPSPQKRKRIGNEKVQDPDIWMSDGSVIITAVDLTDDEKPVYMLKCHKSFLARHSVVFKDLFGLPQPPEREEHDGLPVVALSDSYQDVRGLLRMMYDLSIPSPSLPSSSQWRAEMDLIAGPLRLATKYDIAFLHGRLSEVLKLRWPATLDAWDERAGIVTDDNLPSPVRVIQLAYDAGIPEVLPSAFYELHCASWMDYEFNGVHREAVSGKCLLSRSELSTMGAQHLCQLLQGRQGIISAISHMSINIPDTLRHPFCKAKQNGYGCNNALKDWLQKANHSSSHDPLRSTHLAQNQPLAMCTSCKQRAGKIRTAIRQYIWDEIPYAFEVKTRQEGLTYGWRAYV